MDEFVREFTVRTAKKIEVLSLETREGADLARLYDVVAYPAIVAVRGDGQLLRLWQGAVLPLIDEVSYYVSAD